MSFSFIIFIIIQLIALAYVIEMMRRIIQRAGEYPMEETARSLPFTFLRLRHVIIIFFVSYAAWIILSIWVYYIFVQEPSVTNVITPSSNSLNL